MNERDALADFREWVKKQGLQVNAAWKLGVSPQYLGDMLRGRRRLSKKALRVVGRKRTEVVE
jgi:DNA-binding transcriptional regulator YdaS (Cro superfamily)